MCEEPLSPRGGNGSCVKAMGRDPQYSEKWFAHPPRLEDFAPSGQDVVQRFLKMNRRLGELAPDLLNVFLVTLFYLVAKQLLQCSALKSLIPFRRMIRNHIRDERSSQPPRLLVRVVRQERIDRLALHDCRSRRRR